MSFNRQSAVLVSPVFERKNASYLKSVGKTVLLANFKNTNNWSIT
jgi:hypothetical protein